MTSSNFLLQLFIIVLKSNEVRFNPLIFQRLFIHCHWISQRITFEIKTNNHLLRARSSFEIHIFNFLYGHLIVQRGLNSLRYSCEISTDSISL